jgi:hypothetical protein
MNFVNLTPHSIDLPSTSIPTSGTVARVTVQRTPLGNVDGVTLVRSTFGDPVDLPDPRPDTIFVVSALVQSACPDRDDLAVPGDLVRDDAGRITGCLNLSLT